MCSISGVIRLTSARMDKSDLGSSVSRMNAALRHRGPDDQGVVNITADSLPNKGTTIDVGLGNTRLAIIDTSQAGHQPMQDPETGNCITYNGETYNYRQLRSEIGDEFGSWHSSSDTEVVLRAYRKWGVKAFAKIRGMFALAIWDQARRRLVLARDEFGIKPLYCFFGPDERYPVSTGPSQLPSNYLAFASEVRALMASGLVPSVLSADGLSSFLEFGSVQAPLTIVRDVWSLMPGTCLTIAENSSDRLEVTVTDFRSQRSNRTAGVSQASAKSELRGILEQSVKEHLVSDVPLGVFLSGGMDSSAIVALMSRVSKARPETFSVVFAEKRFDETRHSRAVAERFNTVHHELTLSEDALFSALPDALTSLDQPSMDGVNTFIVSRAVKSAGITVALSGLGGDELFGGYPSFGRALRMQATNRFTRSALRSLARVGSLAGNGDSRKSKAIQLALSDAHPETVYRISRQLFAPPFVQELMEVNVSEQRLGYDSAANGDRDTVSLISKLELKGYMANTLLRDTDSMSMAHSLEVRVPFVDKDVVDCVLSMPGEWKVWPSKIYKSKPLLAELMSDLLPQEFLERPKMGFTLPFEYWMRSRLRPEISSVFDDSARVAKAGLQQGTVVDVWKKFLQKPKEIGWSRPWSIYVLAKWCQANGVTAGVGD